MLRPVVLSHRGGGETSVTCGESWTSRGGRANWLIPNRVEGWGNVRTACDGGEEERERWERERERMGGGGSIHVSGYEMSPRQQKLCGSGLAGRRKMDGNTKRDRGKNGLCDASTVMSDHVGWGLGVNADTHTHTHTHTSYLRCTKPQTELIWKPSRYFLSFQEAYQGHWHAQVQSASLLSTTLKWWK